MIPVIVDPRLQELYAAASNEMMLTQGIVNTAHDAFCAALNERLEAADTEILEFIGYLSGAITELHSVEVPRLHAALIAYRQSKEQP